MSENKGLIINNIQIIDNNLQINYKAGGVETTKYNCINGYCMKSIGGNYKSLRECQKACKALNLPVSFKADYGYNNIIINDSEVIIKGRGRVFSTDSYNLLGGSISYDIDLSKIKDDVNGSGYLIYPKVSKSDSFKYCDASYSKAQQFCFETDLSETNGPNAIATTWHSINNDYKNGSPGYFPKPCVKGSNNCGCNQTGCYQKYYFNKAWYDKGECNFKGALDASEIINTQHPFTVYTEFTTAGEMTTLYKQKGMSLKAFNNINNYNSVGYQAQKPEKGDQKALANQMQTNGAVIIFSMWQGWSPLQNFCKAAPKGSILDSQYTISNIKVNGVIVQKSI